MVGLEIGGYIGSETAAVASLFCRYLHGGSVVMPREGSHIAVGWSARGAGYVLDMHGCSWLRVVLAWAL